MRTKAELYGPISYEDWIADHPEILQAERTVKKVCGMCDGTGRTECEECGQERHCPNCDADGKIDLIENSAQERYEQQIKEDKARLERYRARTKGGGR